MAAAFFTVWLSSCGGGSSGASPATDQTAFNAGYVAYNAKSYTTAAAAFDSMIATYPSSTWADNAQYQIGKTYYDELNYGTAIVEFNKVLANYAALSSADDAQYYMHARCTCWH